MLKIKDQGPQDVQEPEEDEEIKELARQCQEKVKIRQELKRKFEEAEDLPARKRLLPHIPIWLKRIHFIIVTSSTISLQS
jgi:hypothetical protein